MMGFFSSIIGGTISGIIVAHFSKPKADVRIHKFNQKEIATRHSRYDGNKDTIVLEYVIYVVFINEGSKPTSLISVEVCIDGGKIYKRKLDSKHEIPSTGKPIDVRIAQEFSFSFEKAGELIDKDILCDVRFDFVGQKSIKETIKLENTIDQYYILEEKRREQFLSQKKR